MICFEMVRPLLKSLGKAFQNTGNTYQGDLTQVVQRLLAHESEDLKPNSTVQLSMFSPEDRRVRVEYILNEKKQERILAS